MSDFKLKYINVVIVRCFTVYQPHSQALRGTHSGVFISAAQGLLCRSPGSKTVTEKIKSFLKIFVRSVALEPRKQKQRGLVCATGRDRCQQVFPLFFDTFILKNFSPPKNAGVLKLRLVSVATVFTVFSRYFLRKSTANLLDKKICLYYNTAWNRPEKVFGRVFLRGTRKTPCKSLPLHAFW
ncbi:MAG: hypothetical protein FWE84_04570 [Firmicutes bacterium]|nr:hypothetical protein [Bacillota bacterium]